MARDLARVLVVTLAVMGTSISTAHAQQPGADVATAQALFDDGKRLMAAQDFAHACPKLVESQRLDPGGGTLFAIAICHESEGKTATAWADYNIAGAEARRDNRHDREQAALEKARALEPKLMHVRVTVNDRTPGVVVTRDGALVGDAQWGTALPVDPGAHAFRVKAPGKVDFETSVDMHEDGKTYEVVIPVLDDVPPSVHPPPPVVPVSSHSQPQQRGETETSGINTQKAWAVVAGAAGVIGLGVGTGFGLSAISKWHDAERRCPNDHCLVRSDTTLGTDAGRAADLSTVLIAVGAGALVAGVVLWITAPKNDHRAGINIVPTGSRDGFGLSLGGAL